MVVIYVQSIFGSVDCCAEFVSGDEFGWNSCLGTNLSYSDFSCRKKIVGS